MYLLREAGIMGESQEKMLEKLQKSVDALSDQVRIMQDQLSKDIREAKLEVSMNSLSEQLNIIRTLNDKYQGRLYLIEAEVKEYDKTAEPGKAPDFSKLPESVDFFGLEGEVKRAELDKCINRIIGLLNGTDGLGSTPLITAYYGVLKDKLPFEHNAGEALYNFINYVTSIETTGLELYKSYCLFNNMPRLEADLNTLKTSYGKSIVEQENGSGNKAAILPDKSIFSVKTHFGTSNIGARLNKNGKYYVISKSSIVLKDNFVTYDWRTKRCSINYSPISESDFNDLFYYRDQYYSYMTPKQYLSYFGGYTNLPDWLLKAVGNEFMWFWSGVLDKEITFYDLSDNKLRYYSGSNLYDNYGSWVIKIPQVVLY